MTDPDSTTPHRPEPSRRGRLGFSRTALSIVGLVVAAGFLLWFFLLA